MIEQYDNCASLHFLDRWGKEKGIVKDHKGMLIMAWRGYI